MLDPNIIAATTKFMYPEALAMKLDYPTDQCQITLLFDDGEFDGIGENESAAFANLTNKRFRRPALKDEQWKKVRQLFMEAYTTFALVDSAKH